MGDGLLGRVVDARGFRWIMGARAGCGGGTHGSSSDQCHGSGSCTEPLDTGVRAINALLTVGRGQRLGLFAGSGVGKSVLLGMMARYTRADVIVVGLIGERGREVKEFVEDILGEDGRARSVVVAAPADAPLLRMQEAYATAVAEHFRDKGKHVLLLMDSLTRYAMAQREIALAIGEPPATKGYPHLVLRSCLSWSSAVAMDCMEWDQLQRFIPCCLKVTTSKIRLQTQRAPFSMDTSFYPGHSQSQAISRRLISSSRHPV